MSQLPLFDQTTPPVPVSKQAETQRQPHLLGTRPPPQLAPGTRWCVHESEALSVGYTLIRRRRKSIGLQVNENGLRISAPSWASQSHIDQAITQKSAWIIRKLSEWEDRKAKLALGQAQWRDQGRIPYLGVHISLKLVADQREVCFEGHPLEPEHTHCLKLPLAHDASSDRIQDLCHAWLQQQAKQYFEQRLHHFAAQSPKPLNRWRLAGPAKRWGSCSSEGVIMLNWRLIHFSKPIIDYVIAHEVAHLKEMNHGPAFWREVERLMPDFAQARQRLKTHDPGSLPLL